MNSSSLDIDQRIRLMAFEWLSQQTKIYADALPCVLLEKALSLE
jgi:hypothetical protein